MDAKLGIHFKKVNKLIGQGFQQFESALDIFV